MEKRIICLVLIFLISCKSDYKKEYKNTNDIYNSYVVTTFDNSNKMIISVLYENKIQDNMYYIRINDEFYQCDENFSKNNIGELPQFSVKREYRKSGSYGVDKLVIKQIKGLYVTINSMTDYTGTVSEKYYYDENYKIKRIEFNHRIYE